MFALWVCLGALAHGFADRANAAEVAPFMEKYCIRCHGPKVQEKKIRFDRPPDFSDPQTTRVWQTAWLMITSGEMPPEGELAPSTQEMTPILEWIREQTESARLAARKDTSDGNGLRRLTARELARHWSNLLELRFSNYEPNYLRFLALDPKSERFINRGDDLVMQKEHALRALELAERLLARALPDPDSRPMQTWTIEASEIGKHPIHRAFFAEAVEKKPKLWLPYFADGSKSGDKSALLNLAPSCWMHEDGRGLTLNPIWRRRDEPNTVEGPFDYITMNIPQEVKQGIVRLSVFARSELPADETALPTLWLDATYDGNQGISLGKLAQNGIIERASAVTLARVDVPTKTTELVFEIPLELTEINFAAAAGAILNSKRNTLNLNLLLRNLAVPSRPANQMSKEERLRREAEVKKPEGQSARPPKGTPGHVYYRSGFDKAPVIVIEKIVCSIRRQDAEAARRKRLVGDAQGDGFAAFAERAWGRPVSPEEVTPFLKFRDAQIASLGELGALRAAMATIMVDYDGLYLFDRRTKERIASSDAGRRLAMTLWGQMPDQQLKTLAASGKLLEPDTLRHEIGRLMADERFSWFCQEFTRQWLDLDRLGNPDGNWANKEDLGFYPRNVATRKSIVEEPARFLLDAFQRNRTVSHLIQPDRLILNAPLATLYGCEPLPGPGWQAVSQLPKVRQGGILTMAGPIAAASRGLPEPQIFRGLYLLQHVLGIEVGTPPANVPSLDEVNKDAPKRKLTVQDKLKAHSTRTCAVCHSRIDSLAFAWEPFDSWGRTLPERNRKTGPVSSAGRLPHGIDFQNLSALPQAMLTQPKARGAFPRAFVRALSSYLLGRALHLSDEKSIDRWLADGNPQLADLLTAIVIDDLTRKE